jgi:hypothetical protein
MTLAAVVAVRAVTLVVATFVETIGIAHGLFAGFVFKATCTFVLVRARIVSTGLAHFPAAVAIIAQRFNLHAAIIHNTAGGNLRSGAGFGTAGGFARVLSTA